MNAYELADEIEQAITEKEFATNKSEKWHKNIADMLRQQADQIAKLEKAQTNAEPVAWQRDDGVIAFFEKPKVDKEGYKWRALYTTPQIKPLTDEEIEIIAKPYCDLQNWVVDKYGFARAIEAKIRGEG